MKLSAIPEMPDDFELVFFGDNQDGNAAMSEEKYQGCIDYIGDAPGYRYGLHMGDAFDAFWIDDKRYRVDTTTATPKMQIEHQIEMLRPIVDSGQLLTILDGNHEVALYSRMERLYGNFDEHLPSELRKICGTTYPLSGSYTQKISFISTDGDVMFKVYITHGKRSITSISPDPHRRRAYMQFRLKRLMENKAGDCICMVRGHSHIVLTTPPIPTLYLSDDGKKLHQHYTTAGSGSDSSYIPPDHRFYGCSGSFLRSQMEGISTYSEVGEYDPLEIGYLVGVVKAREFVDLREVKF